MEFTKNSTCDSIIYHMYMIKGVDSMKKQTKLFATGLALTMSVSSIMSVHAIETDYIDEKWGKPTVVYGGGLNDAQIQQTQALFNITNTENVYEMRVDSNDLQTYLGYPGDTGSLISSVLVKKTGENGVVVNILTPENILNITEDQYANAAITAGVTDCEIEVACISQATGESALTGVYKALEANGETVDPERTQIAQEELEVTNGIANELEQSCDVSSEEITQAMIDIKKELAELKEQNNGSLSAEQIEQLVRDVLQKYGIQDLLSEENIQALIAFAKKYANSDAINSEEVLKQLNELSKTFPKEIQNIYQQAKDSGFFEKIIQWVKDFINSL